MLDRHVVPGQPPRDFKPDWLPDRLCTIPTWLLLADHEEIAAHYRAQDAAELDPARRVDG